MEKEKTYTIEVNESELILLTYLINSFNMTYDFINASDVDSKKLFHRLFIMGRPEKNECEIIKLKRG